MEQSIMTGQLLRLHSIITRGLTISSNNCKYFIETKNIDSVYLEGFLNYNRALMTFIHAHHMSENELVFPFFKDKIKELPVDLLMENHKELQSIIESIIKLVNDPNIDQNKGSFRKLEELIETIINIWQPHIRIEEQNLSIKNVNSLVSPQEQIELLKKLTQHSQTNLVPDYLVVPFILFNLPKVDREIFETSFPEIVTKQLIPITWKPKWESMKPFFLHYT